MKLIDVRSPQEYAEGHINEAICIPEYDIRKMSNIILKNREETIILYCSTGERSRIAQKELKALGYKNVFDLHI